MVRQRSNRGGLRTTLIDAVEVATKRAAELGEQMAAKMGVKRER